MIAFVDKEKISDAAKVYMLSWKASHKNICSKEFIEKHNIEYMKNYLIKEINTGYSLYAEYNAEKPVGIIGINLNTDEIGLLYVLPEEQRKGYGSDLLEFALSQTNSPHLTVLNTNKAAIGLYEKYGFKFSGENKKLSPDKEIYEYKYVYQSENI